MPATDNKKFHHPILSLFLWYSTCILLNYINFLMWIGACDPECKGSDYQKGLLSLSFPQCHRGLAWPLPALQWPFLPAAQTTGVTQQEAPSVFVSNHQTYVPGPAPEPVLHPLCPLIPSFYTHWVRRSKKSEFRMWPFRLRCHKPLREDLAFQYTRSCPNLTLHSSPQQVALDHFILEKKFPHNLYWSVIFIWNILMTWSKSLFNSIWLRNWQMVHL